MNYSAVDAFDQPIDVGDTVAFNPPHYKGLYKGIVTKVNKTAVQIKFDGPNQTTCSRSHFQVVVGAKV